jgi:hypothetical protein
VKGALPRVGSQYDQYIVALRLGLDSTVTKLEPVILERFDDFCASHLRKLVEGYPEAGTLIPKLARTLYASELRALPFQPSK